MGSVGHTRQVQRINMGEFDATDIDKSVAALRGLERSMDAAEARYAHDPHSLSARRFDEAKPAGRRVYIGATGLIGCAIDNLAAFRNLLTSGGVSIWAPLNLIRGVFEPALWCIWILEPPASVERRRRALRREVADKREWSKFARDTVADDASELEEVAAEMARVTPIYQAEAVDLHIPWETVTQKPDMVAELHRLESLKAMDFSLSSTLMMWRGLSGVTHGFMYAAQFASEPRGARNIPGGQEVMLSPRDDVLTMFSVRAIALLMRAVLLFTDRTLNQAPEPLTQAARIRPIKRRR